MVGGSWTDAMRLKLKCLSFTVMSTLCDHCQQKELVYEQFICFHQVEETVYCSVAYVCV